MTPRAQQAFAFFRERGYSPLQAATIVGNLMQESGRNLDTARYGDGGTAWGIGQWRLDRQHGPQGLRAFAARQGQNPADFNTQLSFVDHELRGRESRYGNALRAAQDPASAGRAMISFFRPAGWTARNPSAGHGFANRQAYAAALLGRSADRAAPPQPGQVARQQMMAQAVERTPGVDSETNRALGGTEGVQTVPTSTPTPPDMARMTGPQWERSVNNMGDMSTNPALDFQLRQQAIAQGYLPGRNDIRSPNEPPQMTGLFGLGVQQPNAGWGWPIAPVQQNPLPPILPWSV